MKKLKRSFFLLLFCMLLSGCTADTTPLSKEGFYLDTVIGITLYSNQDEAILDHCFALCEKYEKLFSRTIPTSDVSRINNAKGAPVQISAETAELLEKALYYCQLTNGAFDITTAPLSDLWDFKHNRGDIPGKDAIEEAKKLVDYRLISLSDNIVTLDKKNASIDLGAIAKGYIADRLKEYLISEGVSSGLINLGGNVLTIGSKPDGSMFRLGIQKPFAQKGTAVTSVDLSDKSLVTSGTYERYFEKDEKVYHHILNPFTGFPYENNLLSVTIISDQSVDGDALSTACFALGLEEGMNLIHTLPNVEALFITSDNQIHDTRKDTKP